MRGPVHGQLHHEVDELGDGDGQPGAQDVPTLARLQLPNLIRPGQSLDYKHFMDLDSFQDQIDQGQDP